MKRYLVVVLCVLLLVSCTGSKNEEIAVSNEVIDIEEVAIQFNTMLKENDFDGLMTLAYSEEMSEYLEKNSVESVFSQLAIGSVVKQYEMKKSNKDGFVIFTTPTEFETQSFDLNLVFDSENHIAGFNVSPFTGESNELEEKAMDIALDHHIAFAEGDIEKLEGDYNYTDQMNKAISEGLFISQATSEKYGELLEVKSLYSYIASGYIVVSIPVVYEKKSFNYDLAFDMELLIAGLSFSEFAEKVERVENNHIREIPMNAEVNSMSLPGILTLPKEGSDFPIIILVHGSGASDKDETILGNKPFRDIAWGLAERGVATYRYDKSTYAYPEKFQGMTELTLMDETVNDAVDIFKMIKDVEEIDSESVYILGHSLGGLSIPLIAEEVDAKGYVIAAGNVRPIQEIMLEQIEYLLNLDDMLTKDEQDYIAKFKVEIDKIRNIEEANDDELILGTYKAYWEFLNHYDPIEMAESIDELVFVVQGERDYQVTLEDYNLWLDAFSGKDNWSFKTYPSLNHLLMPGEGKPSNEEYKIINQVSEELITDIADWVKSGL